MFIYPNRKSDNNNLYYSSKGNAKIFYIFISSTSSFASNYFIAFSIISYVFNILFARAIISFC